MQLYDTSGRPASLEPASSDAKAFHLYAALTQDAFDTSRRLGGEIYVATFKQVDAQTWETDESLEAFKLTHDIASFKVRLIEVMVPTLRPEGPQACWPAVIKASDLWRELFPRRLDSTMGRCDSLARIVRVSPPLSQNRRQENTAGGQR